MISLLVTINNCNIWHYKIQCMNACKRVHFYFDSKRPCSWNVLQQLYDVYVWKLETLRPTIPKIMLLISPNMRKKYIWL